MMGPVNGISDIMHITGNFGKLSPVLFITELFQYLSRTLRHQLCMLLGMIRISQDTEIVIAFLDQTMYFFVVF